MTVLHRQQRSFSCWRQRNLCHIFVFICLACSCYSFCPLLLVENNLSITHHSFVLKATSSKDLKDERKRRKKDPKKEDVVKRLARAAATAAALYPPPPPPPQGGPIGNLQKLTEVIDQQLLHSKRTDFLSAPMQARDSMSALLGYNDENKPLSHQPFHVALVFGKALLDDQVTVEYAARIRCLVELLRDTSEIQVACFCGSTAPGNHIADADAGYVFFRHLCASQKVNLNDLSVYIDRTSKDEGTALHNVMINLQTHHVPHWLSTSGTEESAVDEYGLTRKAPRKKIHVHISLISTGYHLCNLNDIHHRSPGQSLLRPIKVLRKEYSSNALQYDDDDGRDPAGIVETSWSYRYATYPYLSTDDDSVAFMGRCYLLGEELMPLFINLKGIVNEKEFFQRDNYLVLASIRRALVSQMEELYKTKPSLRSDLRRRDVNVVLEGVVLSLGRCIDLVRPAGLLLSSVSKTDFAKAIRALDHAMSQIRTYCDPDAPLDPSEWGKLTAEETDETSHERLYTQLDASLIVEEEPMEEERHESNQETR